MASPTTTTTTTGTVDRLLDAAAAAIDDSAAAVIGLNSWIDAALHSLKKTDDSDSNCSHHHQHRNHVVCSDEYLSCALKIAHCLAEQLCVVDVGGDEFAAGRGERRAMMMGTQDIHEAASSWTQFISVRFGRARVSSEEKKEDNGKSTTAATVLHYDDLEPVPLNHYHDHPEPEDLQLFAQQLSLFEDEDNESTIGYLDVKRATLREDIVAQMMMCINDDAQMQMQMKALRSLGISLFTLFSGGQKLREKEEKESSTEEARGIESYDTQYNHQSSKKMYQMSSESPYGETLKSLGLPIALCELISNMIDATGDDSYTTMSAVRDDLKMLMDKPDLFLQDLDITHISDISLQLETSSHTCFGRETELETLKESYHRSISSECEVVMISGPSGIGKSMLSSNFCQYITLGIVDDDVGSGGIIILSGGFDRLQAQPFQSISSAFDQYCTWLLGKDQSTIEKVSSALRKELGKEVSILVTLMPNLEAILGSKDSVAHKVEDEKSDDVVDAQQRLRYLFCQFVEIISKCHEESLILFLDDCQWIDSASTALLHQLLVMSGSTNEDHRFFFFGCCRDDEMTDAHPLTAMFSSLDEFGIKTTTIHLSPMTKEIVNEMVSTALSLLPRLTQPLSDMLHHKTKGNPLFVNQLMMNLNRQRLLYPSLSRRRWVWDSDEIRDMEIPENVAVFITKSFDRLPLDVLSALCVLSCFGKSVDVHLIQLLEIEIQIPLIDPLDIAVTESVLGKRNGDKEFYFLHDKLQEAAYSMIKPEICPLQHFRYGLAIGQVAVRDEDDKLLITAVEQMNLGGPKACVDGEQGVAVARMNLDAGKTAMKMSDFSSAYSFFDHGISYLRKGHWREQYELSLELFNLAAKCALMNADHAVLDVLTGQILYHARCFEDKCQAINISLTLLYFSGQIKEAINTTIETLSNLGERLGRKPWWMPERVLEMISPTLMEDKIAEIKIWLSGVSDRALLRYPTMVDPLKLLAMKLLTKLYECLVFSGESSKLYLVLSKMMQMTREHGMSPLSPLVFVLYSNYLGIIESNYEEGRRYVSLGLSLMKQYSCGAHDGQIMFHATHTKLFVEPLQSAQEHFLDSMKVSLKSGATRYAMKCALFYGACTLYTGSKKLKEVVKFMEDTLKQMRYHKNLLLYCNMLGLLRTTQRLIGESMLPQISDLRNAFGETLNEHDILQKVTATAVAVYFQRCYEAFMFREVDKARDFAEKFFELICPSNSSALRFYNRQFYFGLVSFWIGRDTRIDTRKGRAIAKKWKSRGVEAKNAIGKLAVEASSWNFQNKSYILQAEEMFSERNFEAAERLYDDAISSSKLHKFLSEEALSNELAAHFYLETGRKNKSVHYFAQAADKYREWGALAKAATLEKYCLDQ